MNVQNDPKSLSLDAASLAKFAVGQPVPRSEDPKLVQGQGRYTDDVTLPGQVYAVIVRSRNAHGIIKKIDTTAAKAMPGVLAVYTGAEINAGGYGPLKTMMPIKDRSGELMKVPLRFALATEKVRFVGDPVACVIATTVAQAKDAAEAVEMDIETLPSVTMCPATFRPTGISAIPQRSPKRSRTPPMR